MTRACTPIFWIRRTPSHGLADVALRRFNLKISGNLAEAADITGRLATALAQEVEQSGLKKTYEEIDLPLVPVLCRMEEAGVKIDNDALARMSTRLEREIDAKASEIYGHCGFEFNINSPKQLGDVLFNQLNLPKPVKYGKGKTISTAVDVLEGLAASHEVPRLVLEYRQLSKLKSTYVDTLPALLSPATGRLHTTFDQTGTATGRFRPLIRTCRTSPSAPNWAAKSAPPSRSSPDTFCSPPTTRRSNSACLPISRTMSCWWKPSVVATTFTRSPRRRFSACLRSWSPPSIAARPKS